MIREFYKHNYIKTLQYSDTAFALAKRLNDPQRHFRISRAVGSAFVKMGDTSRAKKIFTTSWEQAELRQDTAAIAKSIADLGNFYNVFGNPEQAISSYTTALEMTKETQENFRQLYILHNNLAELYLNRGEVEKASPHVERLEDFLTDSSPLMLKSGAHFLKGKFLSSQKYSGQAIEEFITSIAQAKKAHYVDGVVQGYNAYLDELIKLGEYKKAHYVRLDLDEYNDQKAEVDKVAAIKEVTERMNVEQYKQELIAKNLENEINLQVAKRSKTILLAATMVSIILTIFLVTFLVSSKKRKSLVHSLTQSNNQYLEAKKKAEDLSKVKTAFLSAISHELRTPLYGIIGIASILQQNPRLEDFKEDLGSLKFSADYLLALINDLLFLNKIESFKNHKLEKEPFDIRLLVNNILNSLEFMRNKNNNYFDISISNDVPRVLKGDHVKLSQILINLIGNACKFTEEGTIKVVIEQTAFSAKNASLKFTVTDNGIGISEEKQAIIFEEFTQDKKSNTFHGTGLGLAIVKRLISLHDSSISLKSELNKGTEFSFTIDYEVGLNEELKVVQDGSETEKSIQGCHILIVDDNKINRLVTRKILESNSFVCTLAENGQIALEAAKEEIFDLILMDINMPVMNGIEATTEIRKFNAEVPIIALTATDPSQLDDDFASAGFSDTIIKPFETMEFLETIRHNFLDTLQV